MNKKNIAIISVVLVVIIGIVLFLLLNNGKKYEVTFDTAGGNTIETQVVKKDGNVTRPTDPTKANYEFVNWYLNDEVFDFTTPITKNITLTAKWKQIDNTPIEENKFAVTFDSNGGSSVATVTVLKDGTISIPTAPTKTGYKFISWQLDGKDFDFKTTITKSITLTAKWEKVSTNTNNNNNNKQEETKPSTISVSSVSISKSTLSLNVGENSTLSATINPSNATNKSMSWSSSNSSVATVDQNGKVVAVGSGTATITVTASGKTASCTVTVIRPITYSIDWVKVEDSSMGQYLLYIKSSEGTHVSGVVTITTSAGKTSDVNITASGKMYIKSAVSNAVVKSVN